MLIETEFIQQETPCAYVTLQNLGTGGYLTQLFDEESNCDDMNLQDQIGESSKFSLNALTKDDFAIKGLYNDFYLGASRDDAEIGCSLANDETYNTKVFTIERNPEMYSEAFISANFASEFELANGIRYLS
jgi:hypothetical protein